LQGGIRSEKDGYSYRNAFVGVSSTIYISKFFGIEGLYRHYFDSTPKRNDTVVSGSRYEGTAFIDFSFLRLYGTYFAEPYSHEAQSTAQDRKRQGVLAGIRFFF